ncbi:MAG: VOC family protein [Paracoccaceae bacterium]|nr:VOC family protein [Paracoccaceae bacterium]
MNTSNAPMQIGRVALTVNDITKVGDFYQTTLGLERLSGDGEVARFGAGGRVLLELRADRAARRAAPREAGLFHTAFLLPDRADLGRWLLHASDLDVALAGASDHAVSEALYLSDPEGNGIEIYIDRPRALWSHKDGQVQMTTERLDLQALAAAGTGPWTGAPDGTVVGHVHLQVGALPEAEAFYAGTLGFALTCRYPGGSFYGSGGYHHHLASNIWNSRGAGPRALPATGLADLEIRADAAELAAIRARSGGADVLQDPWGTSITITAKNA